MAEVTIYAEQDGGQLSVSGSDWDDLLSKTEAGGLAYGTGATGNVKLDVTYWEVYQLLCRFDLASNVPSGATIDSVTLEVTFPAWGGGGWGGFPAGAVEAYVVSVIADGYNKSDLVSVSEAGSLSSGGYLAATSPQDSGGNPAANIRDFAFTSDADFADLLNLDGYTELALIPANWRTSTQTAVNCSLYSQFETTEAYRPRVIVEYTEASGQDESGGSATSVTATAAGAGTADEEASGGAAAAVTVAAGGSGDASEQASGGAAAAVTATASGSGAAAEQASGGNAAAVTTTVAGQGQAGETASGGSAAAVTAVAAGVGTAAEAAAGGAAALVTAEASGGGESSEQQAEQGGSAAAVTVAAAGAGTAADVLSGGGSATVTAQAAGAGTAVEQATGGAAATVAATASGTGSGAEAASGGAIAVVTVLASGAGQGSGQQHESGGSVAAVTVTATAGSIELEGVRGLTVRARVSLASHAPRRGLTSPGRARAPTL